MHSNTVAALGHNVFLLMNMKVSQGAAEVNCIYKHKMRLGKKSVSW